MGQLQRTDSIVQPSENNRASDVGALVGALEVLAHELVRWSSDDPQLKSALHEVALFVASSTSGSSLSQSVSGPHLRSNATSTAATPRAFETFDSSGQPDSIEHASQDGGDRDSRPRYSDVADDDLPLIIKRCRLKAEGTRWAVERDELLRDGADFAEEIRPVDAEIIEQAKALPNCFLWMNQPRNDTWTRADDYLLVADCFDTLADTLEAMHAAMGSGNAEQFMEAVLLVAEAQSAVRCAVAQVETHADSDQQQTYHWLRNRASRDRFYISRFMRISDPADPEDCDSVSGRAQKLKAAVENTPEGDQAGSQTLRVRVKLLSGILSSEESDNWDEVIEVLEGICGEDYQAILPELCQLLLPFESALQSLELPASVGMLIATVSSNSASSDSAPSADAA
jgi:hypothetical protein